MSDLTKKPLRGLGRGLDALLPVRAPATPERPAAPAYEGNVFTCPLERIVNMTHRIPPVGTSRGAARPGGRTACQKKRK